MTKERYKWELEGYLNGYPLGTQGYMSLEDEYNKISVVSYIVARDMNKPWQSIVNVMCEIRGFTGSKIPSVAVAERKLNLRSGFLDDWNCIQYLKENNRSVMVGMHNLIATYIAEYK